MTRPRPKHLIPAAALFLSACAGLFGGSATPVDVDEAAAGRRLNAFRDGFGLDAVRLDPTLTRIAEAQARVMAARRDMDHSAGRDFQDRIVRGGYRASAAAENIAVGFRTLAEVMTVWEGSAGHRANFLREDVSEFGIGAASGDDGRIYWAVVLGSERP